MFAKGNESKRKFVNKKESCYLLPKHYSTLINVHAIRK